MNEWRKKRKESKIEEYKKTSERVYEKRILREAHISKFIQFVDSMSKKNSQPHDSEKLRWCNDNQG